MKDAPRADLSGVATTAQGTFPFRVELSLDPVVEFWLAAGCDDCAMQGVVANLLRERLAQAPELTGVIQDPATIVEKHQDVVDLLMSAVVAPASWEREYVAALIPFHMQSFYATPPMEKLLLDDTGHVRGRVNADAETVSAFRRLFAYDLVLQRFYGVSCAPDDFIVLTVPDPQTGLDRHFNVSFDGRFVDVVPVGERPVIEESVRADIAAHRVSLGRLAELLPGEKFVLRGFTVFRATEVTDHEVLSSLKRDLIDKESIVTPTQFQGLQAKLRTLFRRPDLRLGLAALDGERVLLLNHGAEMAHACIFADSKHHKMSEFVGTVYERTVTSGQPLIVDDLRKLSGRTSIEDHLIEGGLVNLMVAPLHYQDRVIGTLELASPNAGDLNPSHLVKLHEVLPLFSMAVQRSMEELNSRIQAFIKEKATAIHPTVEWRFRKSVLESIERMAGRESEGPMELDEIVFEKVHPLYGLADIRGSSTQRAIAIQADLLAQLRLARETIGAAHGARALPALDELRYRIDGLLDQIGGGLRSGDEVGVTGFLRTEVEPLFDHIAGFGGAARDRVEAYRASLDPRLGTIYAERRRFEESVTRIAEAVSSYLELEEQTAQSMVPHYFEKQKTDGVDYQIYVGASLREDGRLDPLSLRNLRLWQLMVTCGIALRADRIKRELPIPLETTHLVLVQHAPLAIRFRFDEKRFDVDGAYDIRYEIVKKRIDKALIRGTNERATQPGRLVVVYSQLGEAQEYRRYIEYLQSLGYLTPGIEELELEELQGVHGLRALRVGVDLTSRRPSVLRPSDITAAG